nr:hypothetical protein [Tanacetum cinerariifolium]
MHTYVSRLKDTELETLIATYDISLDLRSRPPDPNFRMINLLVGDTGIGIYSRIFDSSGVRIPFSSFLLAVLKYFKVHISQLVPLGLRKVPTSFNQDHVDRLKAHVVKLHDISEGVLVRSGLSRVWCNPMGDPVLRRSDNTVIGIHDFLCMPSLDKATVWEEPRELGTSILGRVADRTTSPVLAGTTIPRSSGLAAGDEVEQTDDGTIDDDGQGDGSEFAMEDIGNLNVVSQDKEVKAHAKLFGVMRRTTRASSHVSHGVSEDASFPAQEAVPATDTQPLDTGVVADEVASYGNVDSYFDARVSNIAGDVLERDHLLFVLGPYYIPYPFDEGSGSESPPYTRVDWEEIHGVNLGLRQKELYKDHKLITHGSMLNARYDYSSKKVKRLMKPCAQTQIIKKQSVDLKQHKESTVRPNEEVSGLKADLGALKSKCEVTEYNLSSWDKKHRKYRNDRDTLTIEKAKIKEELLDIAPLVRRFLKSSEFNQAFAGVLNTTIIIGVERGLHMDRTDEEFKELSQKVAGFIFDAKDKFDGVITAFPDTTFHFLYKESQHSQSSLQDIARLEPGRVTPSSQPSSATASLRTNTHARHSTSSSRTFGHTSTPGHLKKKKKSIENGGPSAA